MNRLWHALVIALLCGAVPAWADTALLVENAWVREGPPTAAVLGGFMHLRNSSDKPVEVTEVTSPEFERVEMHRSVVENGTAKMIAQDSLTVPAGGELLLAPGGYHLMLYGPNQPVRAGQQLQLMLRTADDQEISVQAEVRSGMGSTTDHHHHH